MFIGVTLLKYLYKRLNDRSDKKKNSQCQDFAVQDCQGVNECYVTLSFFNWSKRKLSFCMTT